MTAPLTVAIEGLTCASCSARIEKVLKQVPGVTVIEEENVPETDAVAQSMESMINLDGANLILATSFGYYNPFVIDTAKKYPNVQFRHAAPLWNKETDPINAGSYFCYLNQAHFVNGVAAGLSSPTGKIGFVAAKPIPQVINNINSFLLGARSVDPTITCQVIFTGEWSLAVKEAEATNALCDQGCDVITCHVDGPKVVCETAAGRGAFVCGYHADQTALAGDKYLTGAEWNWAGVYTDMITTVQGGGKIDNFVRGGLAENFIKMSPLGSAVSDAARAQFEATKAEIMAGGFAAYKGPLKDNTGAEVVPAGVNLVETDVAIESIGFLVEGVLGSTS